MDRIPASSAPSGEVSATIGTTSDANRLAHCEGCVLSGDARGADPAHGSILRVEHCRNMPEGTRPESRQCRLLRCLWVDTAGITRCRVVPLRRQSDVATDGIGLTRAVMSIVSWIDLIAAGSGLGPQGEVRLTVDPETIRHQILWHPNHSIGLADMLDHAGKADVCCPRSTLKVALQAAEAAHGLTFRFGYEMEFILLRRKEPEGSDGIGFEPFDHSVYSQSAAFDGAASGGLWGTTVLDDMVAALEDMDIKVEQLHAEACPGQFEIVTVHETALKAVDNLVLTRETIAGVARRHGLLATFLPKVFSGFAGSGAHMHLSMWQGGANLMVDHEHNSHASGFLGGIFHHMPGLLVYTMGSDLSFERMQPSTWSGAYRIWGDNREAPLRLCTNAKGRINNMEYKSMDATANPYVAAAALIAAGMQGIREGLVLPCQLNYISDPQDLTKAEREERGIAALPSSLDAALQALEEDTGLVAALSQVFSSELLTVITAVRKEEARHYKSMAFADKVQVLCNRF